MTKGIHIPAAFLIAAVVCACSLSRAAAQSAAPLFRDPKQPVEARINDLLGRMTVEEKVSFLWDQTPAIPRLGIEAYSFGDEALHGVIRPGPATVFPQAIGLAATWDPERIKAMADAISDEARAKFNASGGRLEMPFTGLLTFYSPVVNLARDPRWGRTQETYGEDAYLSGQLGTAFVQGLQGNDARHLKAIATAKHFAVYNQETDRFSTGDDVPVNQLWNYYLAPFRDLVVDGRAGAVMTSYNAINGVPSSANPWLLKDVLRDTWGFKGYVVSDQGAVGSIFTGYHYVPTLAEAVTAAINSGVDIVNAGSNNPECCEFLQTHALEAVRNKIISEERLNQAVANALRARFLVGLFDPPEQSPYARIPASAIGSPEHIQLARQLARESIVLLKNDAVDGAPLLPLNTAKLRKIAVAGPNAAVALFGSYSGIPAHAPVTPVAGIRARAGSDTTVTLIPWSRGLSSIPAEYLRTVDGKQGLTGEYFDNDKLEGSALAARVDGQVHFYDWSWTVPLDAMKNPQFSVRWSGYMVPPITGEYELGVKDGGEAQLVFDGALLVQGTGGQFTKKIHLEAGRSYAVSLKYFHHNGGDGGVRLIWTPPETDLAALSQYDAVIAVIGLNTDIEDEARDRTTIDFPREQEEFIQQVMRANPRTVVVIEAGSPLNLGWLHEHVPAILDSWYPGEQGGNGIADVLFGDYNPSGRLPLTFYASDAQLPPMTDYDITHGRTYMYLDQKPLYPFGYGLSYTAFRYSDLKINQNSIGAGGTVHGTVTVQNTGKLDGDDVMQVYVRPPAGAFRLPRLQLKAFQKVHLKAGESRTVAIELPVERWAYWDTEKAGFAVIPGRYEVLVGASSADIRAKGSIEVAATN
ncbi:MAG: glycoside hydrolase family 3 C-terminal domain-containing protein [Acidobacteriaceae bacterium]|nr:glycoside hydrolase family 3 C-terminal domain-containing protein [Acidobacteriaceae bacterium]